MARKLSPGAVLGLVREVRQAASDGAPLVVTGAPGLAGDLRTELARGGDRAAVREGPVRGAAAVVHVLAAAPTAEDARLLREADRVRVPIVAVLAAPELDARVPYVLATDVVRGGGSALPVAAVAEAVGRKLGGRGTFLAARLPVLRPAVTQAIVTRFSRVNGALGAAVFVPGADLPVLTLNQLRMVLLIAAAHGVEVSQERAPEVLAVIGAGLGLRAAARQALGAVPVAGWAVKGAIAFAGTRALGEAAVRYFEAAAEREDGLRPT